MQEPIVPGMLRMCMILPQPREAKERVPVRQLQQRVPEVIVDPLDCSDDGIGCSGGANVDKRETWRPKVVIVVGEPDRCRDRWKLLVAKRDRSDEGDLDLKILRREQQPSPTAVHGAIGVP